jgi:hypothetical protein
VDAEFSGGGGEPYATVRLPVRGSAYAFWMQFTIPAAARTATGSHEVHVGDEVTFVTSGGPCRSKPFRVT